MQRAYRLPGLLLLCVAILCPALAQAQRPAAYPTKPIRWLNSSQQGGGVDVIARMVVNEASENLGRPLVIDNRAGASGILAMTLMQQAPADGYTLLATAGSLVSGAFALKRVPFDVRTDLIPVALLSSQPYVIVVHPSFPARTIPELVNYAKSKPGAVNYASTGAGSTSHIGMEIFGSLTGVKMIHIPFKSAGPALIELMGGHSQLVFISSVLSATSHVRGGRLRALAVTGAQRSRTFPDVPTVQETGIKGFELTNWYGCFAPRRTPQAILARLNDAFRKTVSLPAVRSRIELEGGDVAPVTLEEFRKIFLHELTELEEFVKKTGFSIKG
jgi:tripartite-type tricarboxylate transporter receptor subunit TctC